MKFTSLLSATTEHAIKIDVQYYFNQSHLSLFTFVKSKLDLNLFTTKSALLNTFSAGISIVVKHIILFANNLRIGNLVLCVL